PRLCLTPRAFAPHRAFRASVRPKTSAPRSAAAASRSPTNMMKRLSLLFALAAATLYGCSGQQAKAPDASQPVAQAQGFKIGIMTGTVSQGEDEFRAAQQLAKKYGSRLKHVTYPDNFMQEQETVIAQLVGLASDPDVKVLVVGQAIPGSVAATRKIREQRPDILIG